MSTTGKILGYGTTLEYDATTVAAIRSLGGPDLDTDFVEVTTFDSADNAREYIAGLIDAGEFTAEIVYTSSGCAAIYALLRTEKTYTMTLSDGSTWVFTAFMAKFGNEVPLDQALSMSVSFKVTGKPVFTGV